MAKDKGYNYFAIPNGGESLSGRNLYSGYEEHRESDEYVLLLRDIPELEDFEGDILLIKVQKARITPLHQDVAAMGVWSKTQFMWPERTVPYYILPGLGKITPSVILFCHSRAISYAG